MFEPGVAYELSPLIRRITAPNPGPMTGAGTNTYLIGRDRIAVIDPGPAIDSHIEAILDAANGCIEWILCTHTHMDHSPAAAVLAARSGGVLIGASPPADQFNDQSFQPQIEIDEQFTVATDEITIESIHTPGHVGNHYCFYLKQEQIVFAGDHIMNGSTVVIIPPSGNMKDYIESLQKLLERPLSVIAPAHGDLMASPEEVIRWLVAHRLKREAKVVAALTELGPSTLAELVLRVYDDVDSSLHPMAKLSLHAHLIKLVEENRACEGSSERWSLLQ